MTTVRPLLAAILAVGAIALAGCATTPGGTPAPTTTTVPSDQRLEEAQAAPPEGPVTGTGTVLDTAGEAQLCLGPIMESFPPQCQGVPLDGWSWEGLDGSESSGDTTWGAYAVTGTYDGTRFTRTEAPVLLALYDPAAPEDPTGGVAGTTGADELDRVQTTSSDDSARRRSPPPRTEATSGCRWSGTTGCCSRRWMRSTVRASWS